MAASTPQVPETSAEHDARQLHAGHRPVDAGEIAIGVIIGRTSEFFDFFVYAIASVLVFPTLIFSFADPLTGTLLSFGVFALAFVARPVGTASARRTGGAPERHPEGAPEKGGPSRSPHWGLGESRGPKLTSTRNPNIEATGVGVEAAAGDNGDAPKELYSRVRTFAPAREISRYFRG